MGAGFSCYWDTVTKLNYLQRRIIVASIMYYEFNDSVIADTDYDELVRQYMRMVNNVPREVMAMTTYFYVMSSFDGSTGYHLYKGLRFDDREDLISIGYNLLRQTGREPQRRTEKQEKVRVRGRLG